MPFNETKILSNYVYIIAKSTLYVNLFLRNYLKNAPFYAILSHYCLLIEVYMVKFMVYVPT